MSAPPFRLLVCALAQLGALSSAPCAWAQPAVAAHVEPQKLQATIVAIDGNDVVIDAGDAAIGGARTLTVYRTIEVRHPVSRKLLRDRFVIGTLSVTQTGETLSVTQVFGSPAHAFAVGDLVELQQQRSGATEPLAATTQAQSTPSAVTPTAASSAASPNSQPATTAQAPESVLSIEDRHVLAYWKATLSKSPDLRIRLYLGFLQKYPDSRYREFVDAEIKYLSEVIASARAKPQASTEVARATLTLSSPRGADEDEPVEIAAHLRSGVALRSLILHARALEHTGFDTFVMQVDARGHARATVPASIVRAPGFAFFVEAVDTKGEVLAAHATVDSPSIVTVKPKAREAKLPEPNTRVRFTSEVVSFDGTSGRDYFLVNEGDFLYRVRFHRLYGVRLGYGNYRGQGGTVEELDVLHGDPKPAGFTYGFVETELELHRLFGAAIRGTIGLGRPDNPAEQRDGVTGGFQLRARIGAAASTHLVLAGELLPEIGQRAYIGLHWEAIAKLPMAAEVVVTDQPVNSDELAVRLIYEVGYRFSDRIAVALRPSYQLRTIRHAGPGIGLAATFDW